MTGQGAGVDSFVVFRDVAEERAWIRPYELSIRWKGSVPEMMLAGTHGAVRYHEIR